MTKFMDLSLEMYSQLSFEQEFCVFLNHVTHMQLIALKDSFAFKTRRQKVLGHPI